jgi:uncharacterized membrane protein
MAHAIQNKKEMIMKKTLNTIIVLVFLAPLIYLAINWSSLPAKVPMHYGINGKVDRYGSPAELLTAALILTAVNIGTWVLLTNIHRIDRKFTAENAERMHRMAFGISVFISTILVLLIYTSARNTQSLEFLPGIILSAVGLLLSFIGNYMYNIKPNYFAGIRLPWTLNDENNWKKTHHLAGKMWFVGGLVIAIVCLLLPFKAGLITFLVATAILVLIPSIYSYQLYKKRNVL